MSEAVDNQKLTSAHPAIFHRPPVTDDHVGWHRLEERIRGDNSPVLLVVAPAGYGKTTLASRIAEDSAEPVTWISLSESQDNIRTFLYALAHGWNDLYPQAATKLRQFAGAEQLPAADFVLGSVSAEVSDDHSSSVLILDDYHRIHDIGVHELVESILNHLLHRLRVVILSRSSPPLRLGRLRSHGHVIDVRQRDLCFTLGETRNLVSQIVTMDLGDQALQRLQSLTEGWPAGLRLILLAAAGHDDIPAFLMNLKGNIWQIEDYLIEEVLSGLEDSAKEVLVRAAVLEEVSEELVNAIAPMGDGENREAGTMLMEVFRTRGMFAIALDSSRKRFRLHPMFHELLRRHSLATLSPEEIRSIKKQAAIWMDKKGERELASRYYVAAGDTEMAADAVIREGVTALNLQNPVRVERLLKILPDETIEANPDLLFLQAWSCMLGSRYSGMCASIDALQRLARTNGGLSQVDTNRLSVLESSLAFLAAQFEEILQIATDVPKIFSFERASAIGLYGIAKLLTGSKADAQRYLYAALEAAENDVPFFRARILIGVCFCHWYAGELHQLKMFADRLLTDGKERQDDFAIIYATWFKAAAEYFLNDLDSAKETLQLVEQRSWWPHQHSFVNCVRIAAAVHLAEGDIDKADRLIEGLIAHQIERNTTTWLPELLASQADTALLAGRDVEAYRWAFDYELGSISMPHGFGKTSMTAARLLLRQGSRDAIQRAGYIIDADEAYFSKMHADRFALETQVLRALHLSKTGDMDTATAKCTEAVLQAKPNKNIRVFADFGPDIAPLLSRVQLGDAHLQFIGEILRAIGANRNRANFDKSSHFRDGDKSASLTLETLSKREMEVLELVASNLTYKEIAEKLFISPATVKRHTHNIYGKLDAKDRRAAVAKASGLGLV